MPPPRHAPPRPAAPGAQLLNQAIALHQAGRLDEAESHYRQVLQATPGHFDATHLLGVIALQRGDLAGAEAQIGRALALKPKDAPALANLGTALMRADRLDEALVQFERAVKAQPGFAAGQANLGTVLRRKEPDTPRPYRVPGYPVVPWLFIIFAAAYLVLTIYNDITAYQAAMAEGKPAIINSAFGSLLVLIGTPIYFYYHYRTKRQVPQS